MTHPLQLLRWGWPRSQSIDPPQYILEQFPRDLGHLEMTYRAPASSKRRCIRLALCCRAELDMETLVWTRGRAFPLSRLDDLAPTTPQVFATGSEHYIQLSQPDLVINTARLIIDRATPKSK
jgi:hypothetical protein